MNELTTIGTQQITVKEFKGQRVVTFKDIDLIHERAEETAKRNFNQNKAKLIKDEDYFKVCVDEIRTNKIMDISNKTRGYVTLLTEQGYLMLVKSFTDDLAWQVQRQLVNNYFKSGKSLELAFQLIEEFKAEIGVKITELAEQANENHRPSHKTKLDYNSIIKTYAVCKGDEELLKQMTLNHFNATKWEDIPYSKRMDISRYIRTLAQELKMFIQESLY